MLRLRYLPTVILLGLLTGVTTGCEKSKERLDLTRYVSIYPGSPIVPLPGAETRMAVVVRNVSETKLTALRLEVKSEACTARIEPSQAAELIPGERQSFAVALKREPNQRPERYPLLLTLYAQGLPAPAGLDLMVDLSPPMEKGWINVGQVTLISSTQTRTAYYLLAGAPLLFLLGWLLWRWNRRRAARGEP